MYAFHSLLSLIYACFCTFGVFSCIENEYSKMSSDRSILMVGTRLHAKFEWNRATGFHWGGDKQKTAPARLLIVCTITNSICLLTHITHSLLSLWESEWLCVSIRLFWTIVRQCSVVLLVQRSFFSLSCPLINLLFNLISSKAFGTTCWKLLHLYRFWRTAASSPSPPTSFHAGFIATPTTCPSLATWKIASANSTFPVQLMFPVCIFELFFFLFSSSPICLFSFLNFFFFSTVFFSFSFPLLFLSSCSCCCCCCCCYCCNCSSSFFFVIIFLCICNILFSVSYFFVNAVVSASHAPASSFSFTFLSSPSSNPHRSSDFTDEERPSDMEINGTIPEICHFRDYRNPPGDAHPYDLSTTYWHVYAAKFIFVVLFQVGMMYNALCYWRGESRLAQVCVVVWADCYVSTVEHCNSALQEVYYMSLTTSLALK